MGNPSAQAQKEKEWSRRVVRKGDWAREIKENDQHLQPSAKKAK